MANPSEWLHWIQFGKTSGNHCCTASWCISKIGWNAQMAHPEHKYTIWNVRSASKWKSIIFMYTVLCSFQNRFESNQKQLIQIEQWIRMKFKWNSNVDDISTFTCFKCAFFDSERVKFAVVNYFNCKNVEVNKCRRYYKHTWLDWMRWIEAKQEMKKWKIFMIFILCSMS